MEDFIYPEFKNSVDFIYKESLKTINEIDANIGNQSYEDKIYLLESKAYLEEIANDCRIYLAYYSKNAEKSEYDDEYRVQSGDTLVSISNIFYGDPTKWHYIYKSNELKDVDISNVEKLRIPRLPKE